MLPPAVAHAAAAAADAVGADAADAVGAVGADAVGAVGAAAVVYVSRLCGKERRRRAVVNGRRAKLS